MRFAVRQLVQGHIFVLYPIVLQGFLAKLVFLHIYGSLWGIDFYFALSFYIVFVRKSCLLLLLGVSIRIFPIVLHGFWRSAPILPKRRPNL